MLPVIAASVLTFAANSFFDALIGNVADDVYTKLKGDAAQRAFKKALGTAIKRYASGGKLSLARPLLKKEGFLTEKSVAEELSQLLRFEREPNYQLIGSRWKDSLESPPVYKDFTQEAKVFVDILEEELRSTQVFQPVFQAKDLKAIAINTEVNVEVLREIEAQIEGLSALLDARFGEWIASFANASYGIRPEVRDFSLYIEEKSRGFVGRQWVFDTIDDFIDGNARGYFFIMGDPGIGKSALASELMKRRGYIHHFNIKAENINKASTFLKNVCAQLIAVYGLEHTVLPPDVSDDAGFLNRLLNQVSARLQHGEQCVILIDALDEVDRIGHSLGTNLLYLPVTVPRGVYFIVTLRDVPEIVPFVQCEREQLEIDHDSADNLSDVRDYITSWTARPGIQMYVERQQVPTSTFVDMMVEKSEGNFMYLRFVLPEIERGAYQDRELRDIPATLQGYYEEHWQRMKGKDIDAWFEYKLPTIVGLTIAQEPISVEQISHLTKVKRSRVRHTINEWRQFLHEEDNEYEGERVTQYRLYHLTFFEFVKGKEEVEEEQVDLTAMHTQFADTMWDDLFGDEAA